MRVVDGLSACGEDGREISVEMVLPDDVEQALAVLDSEREAAGSLRNMFNVRLLKALGAVFQFLGKTMREDLRILEEGLASGKHEPTPDNDVPDDVEEFVRFLGRE